VQILLSTTGTLSPVPIADMGDRNFAHPTVDFDLLTEFDEVEIRESADLQAALTAGYVTLKDSFGNPITVVDEAAAHMHVVQEISDFPGVRKAETLTYTDTVNKVIGPLSEVVTAFAELNLAVFEGPEQEYSRDYTVREVVGGSAPGWYLAVSPTSTPPGGGAFTGGLNPGTGIETILVSGDRVRVTYPKEA